MAIEKKLKSVKKGKVEESPSNVFYDQVRGILDNYIKKREDKFKFSARWEYLKNELIKAAEHGGKRIIIRDTNKEFGKGRVYAEWEIDLFTDEYDWLMYYFDSKKNGWRIYWL
jgi:adenosyl cobinamide kinase/adenosyl cobinamide phosphate guanylyltransferase